MLKKIVLSIMIIFMTIGCGLFETKGQDEVNKIQRKDQLVTANSYSYLSKMIPPPESKDSVERRNLVERHNRFNVADKISYIYLIERSTIIAYYVIKGKVSSVNSQLTCTQQGLSGKVAGAFIAVESPSIDGSYGTNGDAVFFFTQDGTYVEWNGLYLLSDRPLRLTQKPLLVKEIK